MDDFRKGIIIHWFNRVRENYSGLRPGYELGMFWANSLISLWIAFDAFLCANFPKSNEREMLTSFASHYQPDYENYLTRPSDDFKIALDALTSETSNAPVQDMSLARRDPVKLSDQRRLENVLNVIYRIRCNLFHGGKDVNIRLDAVLIENSFKTLYPYFERILHQEQIIQ